MWFSKSRNTQAPTSVTLWRKIVAPLAKAEKGISNWTNIRTRHWDRFQQLTFLLCICTVFGAASLLLLFQKESYQSSATTSAYPTLHLNEFHDTGGYLPNPMDSTIVAQFVLVADSLQQTPEGRAVLLQFFSERPGFLDSLELMRTFYPNIPNFKKQLYEP